MPDADQPMPILSPLALLGVGDPAAVHALEADLQDMPQRQLQTAHLLHAGLYARTIYIPAGTLLTGAQTLQDSVCVVVGDITVSTDKGPVRLKGHHVIPASAGVKRVGLAHADTWWTTILTTDQTTVDGVVNQCVADEDRDRLQNRAEPALQDSPQWSYPCRLL